MAPGRAAEHWWSRAAASPSTVRAGSLVPRKPDLCSRPVLASSPVQPPELNPIATAMPTSSSATAVPMTTTAGSRDQGITGFFFFGRGRAVRSKFSAGRAAVSPEPPPDLGSPVSTGMTRESSSVSDQASAGIRLDTGPDSGASIFPACSASGARGASAVAVRGAAGVNRVALVSPGPRAARNAPPMAAVSCGRGPSSLGHLSNPHVQRQRPTRARIPPTLDFAAKTYSQSQRLLRPVTGCFRRPRSAEGRAG